MARKGLVYYASQTGNTEKIALIFKKVFEAKGWECDCVKAGKNAKPDDVNGYDLICIGSPVIAGVPTRDTGSLWMEGGAPPDVPAGSPPEGNGAPAPGAPPLAGGPPLSLSWRQEPAKYKKGVAFVTYTGSRRGPAEAMPALALIELQMEDQGFRCIGKLACPGKHGGSSLGPQGDKPKDPDEMRDWHWEQQSRPHERDLQKAETFLAEIIEDYFLPTEAPPDSQYLCIA
jgi:flavodoxin